MRKHAALIKQLRKLERGSSYIAAVDGALWRVLTLSIIDADWDDVCTALDMTQNERRTLCGLLAAYLETDCAAQEDGRAK